MVKKPEGCRCDSVIVNPSAKMYLSFSVRVKPISSQKDVQHYLGTIRELLVDANTESDSGF